MLQLSDKVLSRIERVAIIVTDCLRWDYSDKYRQVYPPGVWFKTTPASTHTPVSLTSILTGVNADTHGVQTAQRRSGIGGDLLASTNSAVTNRMFNAPMGPPPMSGFGGDAVGWFPFHQLIDDRHVANPDSVGPDNTGPRLPAVIGENELTLVSDHILHDTTPSTDGEVPDINPISSQDTVATNRRRYQDAVTMSAGAHRQMLSQLSDRGLRDSTLFVVVGDHGQAFDRDEQVGHAGCLPTEGVARVPLGFCHSDVSDTTINKTATPRHVDVLPTLKGIFDGAGFRFDEPHWDIEGVDLTNTANPLIGYCQSGSPRIGTGRHEAVWGPDGGLIVPGDGSPPFVEPREWEPTNDEKDRLRKHLNSFRDGRHNGEPIDWYNN
jgi:hypothetical protein